MRTEKQAESTRLKIIEKHGVPDGYEVIREGLTAVGDLCWSQLLSKYCPITDAGRKVSQFWAVIRVQQQVTVGYVTTVSGQRVDLKWPKPEQIRIRDIAWHLANTMRFNAHMKVWYSNAEHCLKCSSKMENNFRRAAALLHDGGEWITGDMTSPVKRMFPEYCAWAHGVQKCVYDKYGLHEPEDLKVVDQRMTATEFVEMRRFTPGDIKAQPYQDVTFRCWSPQDAYVLYLQEFKRLLPSFADGEDLDAE